MTLLTERFGKDRQSFHTYVRVRICSLTMGTLDRFLESRGGKHLGGISQNAVYSSFETQFQTQLDVLNTLDRSPSNAIGAAVGHVLLALKRM